MYFSNNQLFNGKDSLANSKKAIITSTIEDTDAAITKGFGAIMITAPIFSIEEQKQLKDVLKTIQTVYFPVTKSDQASVKNCIDIGKTLSLIDKTVFIAEIPKLPGAQDISLQSYFSNHTAADFTTLLAHAESLVDVLIKGIPADFIRAEQAIRSNIAPLLAQMSNTSAQYYVDVIRKKLKTSAKIISQLVEDAKKTQKKENKKAPEIEANPAMLELAMTIAHDPQLLKKRIDVINSTGVVGERAVLAMYAAAIDSRLILQGNSKSPQIVALQATGHSGSGKSFSLSSTLTFFPEESYFELSGASPKALLYLQEGLAHRCLIFSEAQPLQGEEDGQLKYMVRSLLSEGRVKFIVTTKNEDGAFVAEEVIIEGPTSFITTSTLETEYQLQDRILVVRTDDSIQQTKGVVRMEGLNRAKKTVRADESVIDAWRAFHGMLDPVQVVIPFSPDISEHIIKNDKIIIAARRAFNKVMNVIQTITCVYQHQRQRDSEGWVIANMADYSMALQIVKTAFDENMGGINKTTNERLEYIKANGPVSPKVIASSFGVSRVAISNWTKNAVADNLIVWVKANGTNFVDDKSMRAAKRSGQAYLIATITVEQGNTNLLPTPFQLTNDARWDKDGDLTKLYDLKLEPAQKTQQALVQTPTPVLTTPSVPFPPFLKLPDASENTYDSPPTPAENQDITDIESMDTATYALNYLGIDLGSCKDVEFEDEEPDPSSDEGPGYESIF
ncbi:MAG: hypothetical protein NT178_17145 [Proteobacteria bacterium]|nr:hypothetical protein [Pseudomonadota bacterium]